MHATLLKPRRGWQWLVDGFAIFRRNPPVLGLVVIGYWLLLGLLGVFGFLGMIAAALATPALSVGVAVACRALAGRQPVQPIVLFDGFRGALRPQLILGALYFAATLLVLVLVSPFDDGALLLLRLDLMPVNEALAAPGIHEAVQFAVVLTVPVMFAFWYAPLLVAWHGQPVAKSVFFSVIACVRNWRAFAVYGLAIVTLVLIVPMVAVRVLHLVLAPVADLLTAMLAVPFLLIVAPTLFASVYTSYRDVFESAPDDAG